MENQAFSYWDMVSDDFGAPISDFFDAPPDEFEATKNNIATQSHEFYDASSAKESGSAMARPPDHQQNRESSSVHCDDYEPPANSESAMPNDSSSGAAAQEARQMAALETNLRSDLETFLARAHGPEAQRAAPLPPVRPAAIVDRDTHYPSPAHTNDTGHSSPAASTLIGPSCNSGHRDFNPSVTTPFNSGPATTTVRPAASNQGQNPIRFIDPQIKFMGDLIYQSMTTLDQHIDEILSGHWAVALKARMHHKSFFTRMLKILDTFSTDANNKEMPIDIAWNVACKRYAALLAKSNVTGQENEKLRQENQRFREQNERLRQENEGYRGHNERFRQENLHLQSQVNIGGAISNSAQQSQPPELYRLQTERVKLINSLQQHRQFINMQQRKMQEMQTSLNDLASRQRQQAPQALSTSQIISRYSAPSPQQPVTHNSPPTPMPTQQHVTLVSSSTPVQIEQHNAAGVPSTPPIPPLANNGLIDLTGADDSAPNSVEAPAPASTATKKRSYEWMDQAAPPAASSRPTKVAKTATAKGPVTEKKPAKKPAPKAPRQKASRATKKDKELTEGNQQLHWKEYRAIYRPFLEKMEAKEAAKAQEEAAKAQEEAAKAQARKHKEEEKFAAELAEFMAQDSEEEGGPPHEVGQLDPAAENKNDEESEHEWENVPM
ncbi:MAG: hypothetical protein LQ338_002148 [Usnochroma carphineum]|nr:MAG: hypothetical protein LQ338_002148 [Usnochroma carphineum]